MLHPITVQRLPYDGQSDRYELRAGMKRLKAAIKLNWSAVPALVLPPSLDEDKVREVHLHENLKRSNLEWWAIAEMEAEWHQMRVSQHGAKKPGRRWEQNKDKPDTGWTLADTARELGKSVGMISEHIQLADAIQLNPHLKKVKDRKTALILVKEAARREQSLLEQAESSTFMMNQVLCGDSLEILKEIPDGIFDACITDPPWLEYRDEKLVRDDSTIEVFRQVYRVLKPNAILFAVMSVQDWFEYNQALQTFGFSVQKWPLIWSKGNTMTHGLKPWHFQRDYEPILLAAKGNPILAQARDPSAILNYQCIAPMKLAHPNEKPPELLKKLLVTATFEGAKILDPFAGSGSTLLAARELSREFLGIERDRKFYDKIVKKLEAK